MLGVRLSPLRGAPLVTLNELGRIRAMSKMFFFLRTHTRDIKINNNNGHSGTSGNSLVATLDTQMTYRLFHTHIHYHKPHTELLEMVSRTFE